MPKPFNVVLAEDDAIIALDLQGQLEARGHRVSAVVAKSDRVVGAVRAQRPDAVIMDVRLGGEIDGVTLAEEIFVCEDTPVVFLSAYADQPTSVRAVQSGAYGYLTKPVIIQALISTVGLAIQKHKDLQRCRNDAQILSAGFDALPESVLIVNPQGVVLFLNQAAEALTGWKLHQTRATSPAWADELRRAGEAELGRGTFTSTLRHRTGERLPVSARAIPLRGADVMYVISPVASGGQGSN